MPTSKKDFEMAAEYARTMSGTKAEKWAVVNAFAWLFRRTSANFDAERFGNACEGTKAKRGGGGGDMVPSAPYYAAGGGARSATAYGIKRDYPKIEIVADGKYVGVTTWSRTCREAVEQYKNTHPNARRVTASFQK